MYLFFNKADFRQQNFQLYNLTTPKELLGFRQIPNFGPIGFISSDRDSIYGSGIITCALIKKRKTSCASLTFSK